MRPVLPRRYTAPEIRALLAAIAGGAVLLVIAWLLFGTGPGNALDRHAFTVLSLHTGSLSRQAAHLTETSAIGLLFLCTLGTLIVLAVRRRWVDAATIVLGGILVSPAAAVAKHIAQRPRPSHPLLTAHGFSFPSTDSAISIGLVAVAVGLARLSPATRRHRAVIGLAIAFVAVADLGFISLRVHYLTDVIGGWGLGAIVYAAVALLVDRGYRTLRPAA